VHHCNAAAHHCDAAAAHHCDAAAAHRCDAVHNADITLKSMMDKLLLQKMFHFVKLDD